ncbi:MAG: 1-acyl-sn-glycerol-3-phosphate acyltransferase [Chlamydiales bacterium]
MKSNSSPYLEKLNLCIANGSIPSQLKTMLEGFYISYRKADGEAIEGPSAYEERFLTFLDLVKQQIANPFFFAPYHERVRKPFDYYKFGIDFFRPLIDLPHSHVLGLENIDEIVESLKRKENVILFANHQIEGDPLAINLLLEKTHPHFAEEMIFVAGERVVTDPLAVPFSMGCNLLCIYSKRYIDHPPEQKANKQLHNKRTMQLMSELLSVGGKAIYVAPSGGRDRRNAQGVVEIAQFDPQSIEMLYLMAQKATKPTHFYPLALVTYDLLPPPDTVQKELGETRVTQKVDIHLAMGKKISMEEFPGSEENDKHLRRKSRADYIRNLVKKDYDALLRKRS